jgi:predicted nucleic acid-binding Zn ribbon protein
MRLPWQRKEFERTCAECGQSGRDGQCTSWGAASVPQLRLSSVHPACSARRLRELTAASLRAVLTQQMSPVADGVRFVQPALEFVVQVRNLGYQVMVRNQAFSIGFSFN